VKKPKQIIRDRPRTDFFWALIFASVFIAYLPALNGSLLWDDVSHITRSDLQSFGGLWRIWTELGATQQYYPLLHSAFWVEHRLWGDSMLGYHVANVALHAAGAVLLVLVLRHLAVRGALLAGLIFALHPVCVESVAWVSEQKNTLSAVFYLASAFVYFGGSKTPGPVVQTGRYWLAFGLFICALLTKSVTGTLPAALLVVLWWQRGRLEWRRDVVPLVPWLAVALAAGIFTAWVEHQIIGAKGEAFDLTLVERVLLAGRIIFFYMSKLFWPGNLMFIYPRWTINAALWWQYLFPAGVVGLAIVIASMAWQGRRGPLAGYLFFCGTLVPALGFVNVYPFVFSYVADHFQYLASLGIIVPVASGVTTAAERLTVSQWRAVMTGCAAAVAVLAVLTWERSAVYASTETLFRDTIARNPGAWMAYQNLGTELAAQNRLSEAVEAYQGALQARPDYAGAKDNLVLAHMRLGDAQADKPSQVSAAIAHYEAVLRLDPDHFRAHYNLGTLLMDIPERHAEAIAHLEKALAIQPASVEAHVNLGVALADIPSRKQDAIAHLEAAVSARPDLPVRELLARLQAESGTNGRRPDAR